MIDLIETIDEETRRFAGRYALWHRTARGSFADTLSRNGSHSRGAVEMLAADLRGSRNLVGELVAPYENGDLRAIVDLLIEESLRVVDLALPKEAMVDVSDYSFDLIESVLSSVRDSMRTDEATILQTMRHTQLRASMIAASRGCNAPTAMKIACIGVLESLKLTRTDAIGRRWSTQVMSTFNVRDALMSICNHTTMMALVCDGQDTAVIDTSSGSFYFSITGATSGLPKLDEASEHMHPNARYLVRKP